jgi:DNA-binding transcriptional ArsR family regulator
MIPSFKSVDGRDGERIQEFSTIELLNCNRELTTLICMRPLFHPSIQEVTVEGILHALSDPVRVAIYADIVAQECPQSCSNFLKVSDKAIPKSTLSQHFKILREAGLIRSARHGVEMQNESRCTELEQRFPGLIRAIVAAHNIQSADEAHARMTKPRSGGVKRFAMKRHRGPNS